MKRFNRRRRIDGAASRSNPTQLLNLSLFIMLLAFFIVLNAISSYEEQKSNPILQSLEDTFSTDAIRDDLAPSLVESPLQAIHQGHTVERIAALFEAELRSFDSETNMRSGTMSVEMDLEEFYDSVMTIGQKTLTPSNTRSPPRYFFLPTLVSILQSDAAGVTYRLDIFMHSDENPAIVQNSDPARLKAIVDQGTQIVQRLQDIGMPQRLLSIGLKDGDADKVTIVFRHHVPFSPVAEEEG